VVVLAVLEGDSWDGREVGGWVSESVGGFDTGVFLSRVRFS